MDARMPIELRQQCDRLTQQLQVEFQDRVPAEIVAQRAAAHLEEFHGAKVVNFVPILAWRRTREELRELAAADLVAA
jgi:hypothetical protein